MAEVLLEVACRLMLSILLIFLLILQAPFGGLKMAHKFLLWLLNLPLRIFMFGFWTVPSRLLFKDKKKQKKQKKKIWKSRAGGRR